MPVHERGAQAACGKVQDRLGIQRLEAMLYAVDQVNKNSSLLGNVRLGLDVYDTCSSETVALDKTLNFIHGHLSKIEHGKKRSLIVRFKVTVQFERYFRLMEHISVIS